MPKRTEEIVRMAAAKRRMEWLKNARKNATVYGHVVIKP